MHKTLIEAKYKNFLESNFYFSSDQNKASEILSNVSNENLDLICEKSSKILNNISFSSNKIEVLKIFAHSNFDKIHALAACEKIFDEFSWDSEKIDLFKKLDKIDAAKTYAVSFAKDHLKNLSWKSEKIKLLDDIIYAKTIEEAFDLVGINDYSSNLPFHEIYYGGSSYYNGNSYYYETTYPSSFNQEPVIYPAVQKESPIIHNHYYVNENRENQNSQIVHEEETSTLGTLEWLGLILYGVCVGIFTWATLGDDNYKKEDNNENYKNNLDNSPSEIKTELNKKLFPSLNEFSVDRDFYDDQFQAYNDPYYKVKPSAPSKKDDLPAYSFEDSYPRNLLAQSVDDDLPPAYSKIDPYPKVKPSAPSIDDDLPPSYESLFPSII